MAFPTFTVEVAFASDPYAVTPTWTDISDYARVVSSVKRGRPNAISRVEAGVAQILLDNRDLRFDPDNSSSPYYPNVVPGKRLRISAVYSAVTYRLYTGYVQRWPQTWLRPGGTEVLIEVRDALAGFALADLPAASYPAELSTTRIGRVLDAIGWPAADRVLDTGRYTCVAATITEAASTKALAHLQDVADSELGLIYIDGQGRVVFNDLYHRIDTAADYTPAATFGDGGGSELPYEQLDPDYDAAAVTNDYRVTPSGGSVVVKSDSASITAYGRRTVSRSILTADVNQATSQAEFLLAQTKSPRTRFDRILIDPGSKQAGATQDSLYVQALSRDIGDRVTVKARPPGSGYVISKDVYIEGIEHKIGDTRMTTSFLLSPVDPTTANGGGFWILGDSTYGLLGQTTTLAP